ncbi:crotonase/enoyl-CoA hydratase family protein [Colwellia sp. MSW7]|jgi:enoyl-CoA hydratase/carnithine racemase|uniref:Crotonase/enoyl-CoA hydratase family protein n=1 Tax=Colwellia maritima TaxID=2912588 RepID=A0ABS9X4Q2_9GAMM|nr:crotonase/enoyl-CoA hydratase family protein [Colwellia maritima]MCI2285217.1 crotonase/enoyl-CoA hydratase family protein [Colwellia maritima]
MSSSSVIYKVEQCIAYVSLNRPDKHNGLDKQLIVGLVQAAKNIKKDRSIRCVILQGEGPSFCAGLDFSYVAKNPSMIAQFFLKLPWRKDNMFQRVAHVWRDLPVPVIAVVHGNCFGAGMQIILGCDYRIAMPDANLSILEMKWGLIPDMSGMATLSRLTRVDIAQELTMTGRFFSGIEALEYGLVSKVSETPLIQAQALATKICQQSPDAISAAKYLFKKTWKKDTRAALFWERITQLRLLGRKNQRIAMQNGLARNKQPKPFVDRSSF